MQPWLSRNESFIWIEKRPVVVGLYENDCDFCGDLRKLDVDSHIWRQCSVMEPEIKNEIVWGECFWYDEVR